MHDTFTTRSGVTYPIPEITEGLLEYLHHHFPVERFKQATSTEGLHNLQGQHLVIDHLKFVHKQQNNQG